MVVSAGSPTVLSRLRTCRLHIEDSVCLLSLPRKHDMNCFKVVSLSIPFCLFRNLFNPLAHLDAYKLSARLNDITYFEISEMSSDRRRNNFLTGDKVQ